MALPWYPLPMEPGPMFKKPSTSWGKITFVPFDNNNTCVSCIPSRHPHHLNEAPPPNQPHSFSAGGFHLLASSPASPLSGLFCPSLTPVSCYQLPSYNANSLTHTCVPALPTQLLRLLPGRHARVPVVPVRAPVLAPVLRPQRAGLGRRRVRLVVPWVSATRLAVAHEPTPPENMTT